MRTDDPTPMSHLEAKRRNTSFIWANIESRSCDRISRPRWRRLRQLDLRAIGMQSSHLPWLVTGREAGVQGHASIDEQCGADDIIRVVGRKPHGHRAMSSGSRRCDDLRAGTAGRISASRRKQREGESRPPTQARLRGRQQLRDPRRLHEQVIEAERPHSHSIVNCGASGFNTARDHRSFVHTVPCFTLENRPNDSAT